MWLMPEHFSTKTTTTIIPKPIRKNQKTGHIPQ
jgi:hypothetical protein